MAKVMQSAIMLALACLFIASRATATETWERPQPPGGGPTAILCSIAVLDVDSINDASQNFTVNLFATCRWKDPRQAHGSPGKVIKDVGEVWHPKLIFFNRQKIWTQSRDTVEIAPDGDVVFRNGFWGDFSQPLKLREFPFDSQDLKIIVIAAGAYEHGEVVILEDPESPTFVVDEYSVADWRIDGARVEVGPLELPTGEVAASFTMHIEATRESTHYMVKFIAPLLMIMALSWAVFWLNPEETAQLGVAVTTCLTVIAYHLALSSRLPRIPYLTHMDIFVFGATLLVFLAMIEVVATTRLAGVGRVHLAINIDRVSRVVFPSLLALVMLYSFYWR